jgi:hypothetical protein
MAVGISVPIFATMLRASTESMVSAASSTVSSWFRQDPCASAPATTAPVGPPPAELAAPAVPSLVMGISGLVVTDAATESAPEAARETLDIENDALRMRLADAEIEHTATRYRLRATLEVLEVVSAKLADAQADAIEQAGTIRALTVQRAGRGIVKSFRRVVGAPGRSWACRL